MNSNARNEVRSENYILHVEPLLAVAEQDILSSDRDMISIKRLNKLRNKLKRLRAACVIQ